ncbi:5-formyltetrahydrofolate cyclo-ligase [Thalassolituus sp. LLYu03]|uniref:5-formyltetrahydrofolate cyclo-ligase n=1 Tax=Thalassolituus sp. LLYu03 TaxID=3421656 RepID=UPI003D26A5C8
MNKPEIRRAIRQRRNQLTRRQRQQAARQLLHTLRQAPHFQYASRIALYLTNDAEIDTAILLRDLQRRGRQIFLPVLHPLKKGHLSFLPYQRHTTMVKNRFGISEPSFRHTKATPTRFLGLICMPLVAFDGTGNRLGMGGGFYDRTLMFMRKSGHKPALIGLAYELQKWDELPAEPWDIRLNGIATERTLYRFG